MRYIWYYQPDLSEGFAVRKQKLGMFRFLPLLILALVSTNGISKEKPIPKTAPDAVLKDGTRCWIQNLARPAIIKSDLADVKGAVCLYSAECAAPGANKTVGQASLSKLTPKGCKTFEASEAESEKELGFSVFLGREMTDPNRGDGTNARDYSSTQYRTKDNRVCLYQNESYPIVLVRPHPKNARTHVGFCVAQATCTDSHGTVTTEYPRSEYFPEHGCRPLDEALETQNQHGLALAFDERTQIKVSTKIEKSGTQQNTVPRKTSVQVTAPAPKTASNHKSQPGAVRGFNTSPRPRK